MNNHLFKRTTNIVIFFCACIFLCSCSFFENKSPVKAAQLAMPLRMQADSLFVHLADFYLNPETIDSASFNNTLVPIDIATHTILLKCNTSNQQAISLLKIYSNSEQMDIPVFAANKQVVNINYTATQNQKPNVAIAGDMNQWNPNLSHFVTQDSMHYNMQCMLSPGNYQYQLVVNNQWILDPGNSTKADNNIGGFNSLLTVFPIADSLLPSIAAQNFDSLQINFITNGYAIVLWQNKSCQVQLNSRTHSITIPQMARLLERSYIRAYCYNSFGRGNELLIPLQYGKPITSTAQNLRSDWHTMSMYFLLVDRFLNGNTNNDKPIIDKRILPNANYLGGDLLGVHQKLQDGFFDSLHINTLWVSPLVQNPNEAYQEYPEPRRWFSGYHGYWPLFTTQVDSRLGSSHVLKDLVSQVHLKNKNILLDFVAHHVHQNNPTAKAHPNWFTPLTLPNGKKNIRIWDEQRLTTWFDDFLPTFDFSKPEVVAMHTDTALYWLKEFDLDGFRHDATKHIPESFWRALTFKIKNQLIAQGKPIFQIGETFGSNELISSYINSGELDGQFNFNLYFEARTAFAKQDASFINLGNTLKENFNWYGYHNLMGNITGNHDLPRFISYASGAISWTEDPKEAGYNRKIEVIDTLGYNRLSQLTAFTFTIPGIPILYYGDEYGMPGAGDPDNRRMVQFSGLNKFENETLNKTKMITALRQNTLALQYGDFNILQATQHILVYSRAYFDQKVIVLFNKNKTTTNIELDKKMVGIKPWKDNFGSNIHLSKSGNLIISMAPLSFEILTAQ
jgi:cyclomaltodextrinase